MRFRVKITIFFYTLIFVGIGVLLLLFPLNLIQVQDLINFLQHLEKLPFIDLLTAIVGVVIIIVSLGVMNFIWSGIQKEKNIAFQTDYGQVSVSLFAIEDFVRKLYREKDTIKEIRPAVSVSKKGLNVNLRIVIWSDVNVPNLTQEIQRTIRTKVQEMLGIEEPINVRVHVSKIAERAEKRKKQEKQEKEEPMPPYRNY